MNIQSQRAMEEVRPLMNPINSMFGLPRPMMNDPIFEQPRPMNDPMLRQPRPMMDPVFGQPRPMNDPMLGQPRPMMDPMFQLP